MKTKSTKQRTNGSFELRKYKIRMNEPNEYKKRNAKREMDRVTKSSTVSRSNESDKTSKTKRKNESHT